MTAGAPWESVEAARKLYGTEGGKDYPLYWYSVILAV